MTTVDNIDILSAGAAPLIAAYCREIKLDQIVNDMLRWDEEQWSITPGDLMITMIVSLLVSHAPLYRIKDFYENRDLDLLFGEGKVTLDALHDRHYGSLLDRMFEANPNHVYQSLTGSAIITHQIDLGDLHGDTSSQSVHGAYEGDGELNITFGHSKDHRPDLKQFLYGLVIAEGVPVLGNISDGNTSDKTWNKDIIEEMAKVLAPKIGKGILYVADSALVTATNLDLMEKNNIKFITRLPENYGLASNLKEKAHEASDWIELGKLSDKKDAASYKIKGLTSELEGRNYHFVVVHSTALAEAKKKTLERRVVKENEKLTKACATLHKKEFACEPDARAELNAFLEKHAKSFHYINGDVVPVERIKPRDKKGRRPKNEIPEVETIWRIICTVGEINKEKLEAQLCLEEKFVLMTNELDSEKLKDTDVLKKYKEQISVETKFRWLKNPTVIEGIWLKDPNRVMALGYVFLIGLLVYCLLERRIRKNLSQETKPIRLPGNRLTKKPTAASFLLLFTDIVVVKVLLPDNTVRWQLPKRFESKEFLRALSLAGFDGSIYTTPPVGNNVL